MGCNGDGEAHIGRRRLLASVGAGAATATAGCLGGENAETETTGANEVVVGPDGQYVFEPESLTVGVGETVTWTWDSANHNVVVDGQPAAGDWSGTEGGTSETYDGGYSSEHTFEVEGTYEYYCSPHEGLGMEGVVVVESD